MHAILKALALWTVALGIAAPALGTLLEWDDNTTTAGVQFMNNARNWNTAAPGAQGWTADGGASHVTWNNANNDDALISFGGNNRAMSLGESITVKSLTAVNVNSPATERSLQFNNNTLTVTSGQFTAPNSRTGLILNSIVSSGVGLTFSGFAWARLDSGSNAIGGDITVNDGGLRHGSGADAVYGNSANKILLNNGVFYNDRGNFSIGRQLVLTGESGIGNYLSNLRELTWTGVISGSGSLNYVNLDATSNMGKLTLAGSQNNTYEGVTRAFSDLLELNKSDGAIAIPGDLVIGGGAAGTDVVRYLQGGQIADTAIVTVNASGRLELNNFSDTVASLELATGALVATGTGAGGTLTVTTMTINNKEKAAGTYTAASLGDFVSGNGAIMVLTGPPVGTMIMIR